MDWNEWEELMPTEETLKEATKAYRGSTTSVAAAELKLEARGAVRTYKPLWQELAPTAKIIRSPDSGYYEANLGFELDLPKGARDAGARFSFVMFTARLWSVDTGAAHPRVYDLYPRDLYEGTPRQVQVEFGPEIKAGDVGGSLGKISSDIQLGTVSPVIVAYKGKGEREPRWELTPKEKELIGGRNVWLLVEVPKECNGARLAVRVDADIETKFGPIPVAPKERVWENRPSVLLQ